MIVSFSVVPIGGGVELKEYVAEIVRAVDRSGLPYRTTAMATEIEGDWDRVLAVVREAHEIGRRFTGRVLTHVSIDDREGATGRLAGKVEDVARILLKAPRRDA